MNCQYYRFSCEVITITSIFSIDIIIIYVLITSIIINSISVTSITTIFILLIRIINISGLIIAITTISALFKFTSTPRQFHNRHHSRASPFTTQRPPSVPSPSHTRGKSESWRGIFSVNLKGELVNTERAVSPRLPSRLSLRTYSGTPAPSSLGLFPRLEWNALSIFKAPLLFIVGRVLFVRILFIDFYYYYCRRCWNCCFCCG